MLPETMIGFLADKLGIERKELVEKDLYLQGLLLELGKSPYFSKNFAFKGGTCLTKAYLGPYRFSEDLDFTWLNQKLFRNKSGKQIRKLLSKQIDKLLALLKPASEKLGLDFKPVKSNRRYVELGGSNRLATFKLWYNPPAADGETFIKVQINFVEKMLHKPKKRKIKPLAISLSRTLEFLYPDHAYLATTGPTLYVYDLKEIAAEKVRALLTRRGFKVRDLLDLYMLSKKGISVKSIRKMALEKTTFMLSYLKYRENLKNRNFEDSFELGEERRLLIGKHDDGFGPFAKKTLKQLNEIAREVEELSNGAKKSG